MISRRLWDSKRAAKLSDRAFAQYIMHVVFSDVRGRFEADGATLLSNSSRRGVEQGWTVEDMEAARDEIVRSGLVDRWDIGDQPYAEIDKFVRHNKVREDREADSTIPGRGGSPPGVLQPNALQGESQCEGEKEGEGEKRAAPHATGGTILTNGPDAWDDKAEALRIGSVYQEIFEADRGAWYPNGGDQDAMRRAAIVGTCRPWPTREALRAELLRTEAGCRKRKMSDRLSNLLRHVGESWDDRKGTAVADASTPRELTHYPKLADEVPWVAEARKERGI